MVDVKYIDEQLKVLAERSKENGGTSAWTGIYEFIYNNFSASRTLELSESILTLQTGENMLANLEENLDKNDYKVLQKESTEDRVILYIQTAAHLSLIGHGAIIAVEIR